MTAQEKLSAMYHELAAQYGDYTLKLEKIQVALSGLKAKIDALNEAAPFLKEMEAMNLSAQEEAKKHQEPAPL